MPQQINKKILLYFFLFIILGTFNNKNLNKFEFPKINRINISGFETQAKLEEQGGWTKELVDLYNKYAPKDDMFQLDYEFLKLANK